MKFLRQELITALFLLVLGMSTNVLLGTLEAEYKGTWTKQVMLRGIYKASVIFIGIVVIAFASTLDQALVVNDIPILDFIHAAVIASYVFYFSQVALKIVKLIRVPVDVIDAEIINIEEREED